MRLLLIIAALGAGIVHAAEPTAEERAKATLALEFCARIVAVPASEYDSATAEVPGVTLGPPKPLIEQAPNEKVRELLGNLLKIQEGDELQFAAFDPAPSARTLPFAVFKPKGDMCLVIGARGPDGRTTLATQLAAPDSPWSRKTGDDKELWRRTGAYGETVMLGIAGNESMIVVALEQRPVAAPAEITAITHAAITPCVDGALAATPPPASAFEPAFKLSETEDVEKLPGLKRSVLRSQVPGPRSMLTYSSFEDTLYCEYWTSDARQPASEVLAVVVAAIEALPGIKEVKVKPGKNQEDTAPVLKAWRVARRGAVDKVDVKISIERERVIVVVIEPASGWFK